MKYAKNILETIGNTPLVQLNSIVKDLPCKVLAKVEYFNPGHSCKDRMALKMVEDAEADGRLKPGGTIIEGTSGNTGMGLALAAVVKGYKLICVITDKQSKEKMDILRAVGAKVVVCPTDVEPTDPRSYYSVSKRLAQETPNGWYVNQYDNPSNAQANYEQTGPEIWEQTQGAVTHFIVGVGTGGTISGVGKYLKEQKPNVKVWGVDTYGSVFKKYHETGIFDENEVYSYVTEGIGEDILPENVNFSVIDHFTKVTDKDAAVYCRKLALEEGIFVGMSSGSAIKGLLQMKDELKPDDVVVVLFHDSGSRYIGKIFNDEWMRERGYLEDEITTAADLIQNHIEKPLVVVRTEELVSHALDRIRKYKISQIPVIDKDGFVGSLEDSDLFAAFMNDANIAEKPIREVMGAPYPVVNKKAKVEDVSKLITKDNNAVLVDLEDGKYHIITKYDIINSIK
ncbi:pyridoxal-phosphate dependent enzyme [Flavobacterium sp. xlx-214]|uniref:pyridoxal-phosphate dependent enzyme n=1 Tax=unclassified Flavobacterium TaxID=196869 RepID=UPI0013D22756|nr:MULTISPECIES: pyridoxal-phosphate dependent enzyme [unclassified Flavobacterium]MBA5793410.1 pyridoxal-phosphate dependent enzyme [Flavobacterium sp. xlx-221]QMI84030.1 pyridoxal-phosphate dependent enzyme [Flavobacterium sp. xlx-214]